MMDLEERVPWTAVKKSWGTRRAEWVKSVSSTLNVPALSRQLMMLESALKIEALKAEGYATIARRAKGEEARLRWLAQTLRAEVMQSLKTDALKDEGQEALARRAALLAAGPVARARLVTHGAHRVLARRESEGVDEQRAAERALLLDELQLALRQRARQLRLQLEQQIGRAHV